LTVSTKPPFTQESGTSRLFRLLSSCLGILVNQKPCSKHFSCRLSCRRLIRTAARSEDPLFVKLRTDSGYAHVKNELLFWDKALTLFGDAKKIAGAFVKVLQQ
jgi:hypothetical protein